MTAGARRVSGQGGGHPVLLPWAASGRLDAREAADVRRHLADCPECRRELEALLSMKETMQRHDRTDHVDVVDLVAYEEGLPASDPAGMQSVEAHLRSCASCSEDLAALRRARLDLERQGTVDEPHPPGRRMRSRGFLWAGIATAAATAAAVLGLPMLRPAKPYPAPPSMIELEPVTLSPTSRGGTARQEIAGPGPWALTVLLPFDAPAGVYRISILDATMKPLPALGLEAESRSDGTLVLSLPGLPGEGVYRLRAVPAVVPGGEPIDYPFLHRAVPSSPGATTPP